MVAESTVTILTALMRRLNNDAAEFPDYAAITDGLTRLMHHVVNEAVRFGSSQNEITDWSIAQGNSIEDLISRTEHLESILMSGTATPVPLVEPPVAAVLAADGSLDAVGDQRLAPTQGAGYMSIHRCHSPTSRLLVHVHFRHHAVHTFVNF